MWSTKSLPASVSGVSCWQPNEPNGPNKCALFTFFPKWDFSPESLTSQLFRWAWRAQGLLILAVSSQEVSHAKIKTDLRCRFHHLPLESLKCKPTERKGSPLASGLTAACSVKSEGCCNQETLILFNVITKCLSDYPGLLPGKTTERKCNKKKKKTLFITQCAADDIMSAGTEENFNHLSFFCT